MSVDDITMTPANGGWSPLSHSQQRLWLFQQLMPESIAYNTGGLLRLSGEGISKEAIFEAFEELVEQQDVLRLRLKEHDGVPLQRVSDSGPKLEFVDAQKCSDPEAFVLKDAERRVREPYIMVGEALNRVCLYQVSDQEFVMGVAAHHITTDAWSLQLVVRTLVDRLAGKPKRKLRGQSFVEFASMQGSEEHEEAMLAMASIESNQR